MINTVSKINLSKIGWEGVYLNLDNIFKYIGGGDTCLFGDIVVIPPLVCVSPSSYFTWLCVPPLVHNICQARFIGPIKYSTCTSQCLFLPVL